MLYEAHQAPVGWPERMIEVAGRWDAPGAPRDQLLSEIWVLLNAALTRYIRVHSARYGLVGDDDVRDIASEKSLNLMRRFDRGTWSPAESHPGELCSLISTVARNGLIDYLRVAGRSRSVDKGIQSGGCDAPEANTTTAGLTFDLAPDRKRYAAALRDCCKQLNPKHRLMWYLKSFLEMPSAEIARHPSVAMKTASVDVVLTKTRKKLRACMLRKGFAAGDMPPGTFVTVWESVRKEIREQAGESDPGSNR